MSVRKCTWKAIQHSSTCRLFGVKLDGRHTARSTPLTPSRRQEIRLADFSAGLADFKVVVASRCRGLRSDEGVARKFGRCHAGISREGAIKGSDGPESSVHGDG